MRRRGDDTKVSFFSFQDIITAIAGIMIFIALLLILEVTTSAIASGGPPPPTRTPKQEAERQIRELREELAALKETNDAGAREAKEVSAVDLSAIQEEIRKLERELAEAQQRQANASAQRREKEKLLQDTQAETERARQAIVQLTKVRAKQDKETRRVIVTLKGIDDGKSAVLIELSKGKALVGTLNSEQPPKEIVHTDSAKLEAAILEHMRTFAPTQFDVLVLIKPSAFDYHMIVYKTIKLGFRVGSEPLAEERSVF